MNNQSCTTGRPWLLAEIASVLEKAGQLTGALVKSGDAVINRICIDSRAAGPASLFVALKGERTDGHGFMEQVIQSGAVAALVRSDYGLPNKGLALESGFTLIAVHDPLVALQALAAAHLAALPGITKIGVTGSSGKTTTKDLLLAALGRGKKVFASQGNLNSVIGLPLAALALDPTHEIAVFEMAMSEAGEMAVLAGIVLPDLAIVTNIGLAHIGTIGSQQAIAYEKKQIFSRFDGGQSAFISALEPFAKFLAEGVKGTVIFYGESELPGFAGHESWADGQIINWRGLAIHLRLHGAHNRLNAIAAIQVAVSLGLTPEQIREGMETFIPAFGRGEILHGRVTLVQDCYNANPDSMKAGLTAFAEMESDGGNRVLILGDMLELGPDSAKHHAAIGRLAARNGADLVLFCGPAMEAAYLAAAEIESIDTVSDDHLLHMAWFATRAELAEVLDDYIEPGDLVFLKASRGMEMEHLTPQLLAVGAEDALGLALPDPDETDPELLAKYLVSADDEEPSAP